jgi:hypothetical protein
MDRIAVLRWNPLVPAPRRHEGTTGNTTGSESVDAPRASASLTDVHADVDVTPSCTPDIWDDLGYGTAGCAFARAPLRRRVSVPGGCESGAVTTHDGVPDVRQAGHDAGLPPLIVSPIGSQDSSISAKDSYGSGERPLLKFCSDEPEVVPASADQHNAALTGAKTLSASRRDSGKFDVEHSEAGTSANSANTAVLASFQRVTLAGFASGLILFLAACACSSYTACSVFTLRRRRQYRGLQ